MHILATPSFKPYSLQQPNTQSGRTLPEISFGSVTKHPSAFRLDSAKEDLVGHFRLQSRAGKKVDAQVTSLCQISPLNPDEIIETLKVYHTCYGKPQETIGYMRIRKAKAAEYPFFTCKPESLYIVELATNHWDYQGIGTRLMGIAVIRSIQYGFEGRVKLYPEHNQIEIFQTAGIEPPTDQVHSRINQSPLPFYFKLGFRPHPLLLKKVSDEIKACERNPSHKGRFRTEHFQGDDLTLFLTPEGIQSLHNQQKPSETIQIPTQAKRALARRNG